MAEKNIVMKQLNTSGEYDVLYPQTTGENVSGLMFSQISGVLPSTRVSNIYTKDETLTNTTKSSYGLGTSGVPDGVFQMLSHSIQYYEVQTPKYQEVTVNLASVSEGDIVQLLENGVLVDFYVAKLNYESTLNGTGRTLLVRKDVYDNQKWDSGKVNAYASSDLDSWFNSTYKNMLDADIRSLIGTTKIHYTPGNGNNTVGTLERAIFALSLTELGQSHTNANVEGSALPIASTLRIAYRNGSPTTQWTRSPDTSDTYDAWRLNSNGNIGDDGCNYSYGFRPCFTLPSTFTATYYVDSSGNLHDEQEYESAGSTTDVKGNPISIGTQIATGSYVGTGKYGASNPNTLTLPFEPKIVMINRHDSPLDSGPVTWFSPNAKCAYPSTSNVKWPVTVNGNIFSWYNDSISGTYAKARYQANEEGTTYDYLALG